MVACSVFISTLTGWWRVLSQSQLWFKSEGCACVQGCEGCVLHHVLENCMLAWSLLAMPHGT